MIIRYQCSKLFALPTCSVRKTGEITDGECISLPSIRKTGLITDGASILPPCIRKIGKITDGASKIDVRPPDSARSRRRSFIPPAVLRENTSIRDPVQQHPHFFAETWNGGIFVTCRPSSIYKIAVSPLHP